MSDDAAFIWDRPTPQRPSRRRQDHDATAPSPTGRIPLREAERRFGVRASTLGAWARGGSIDGVKDDSNQWLVTPESIAHHLSRKTPRAAAPARRTARTTGPTDDGSAMLVPRDAWDRLMDQLGNLHEAGLNLAEARERAARAETEASFLRERLAEMRAERDELKGSAAAAQGTDSARRAGFLDRFGWLRGRKRQ